MKLKRGKETCSIKVNVSKCMSGSDLLYIVLFLLYCSSQKEQLEPVVLIQCIVKHIIRS